MRLLILVVFCTGVNANQFQSSDFTVLRPGFFFSCGISPVEKAIGPINENGKRSSENRIRNFAKDNGNGLIDNEEYVRNKRNLVYPCEKNDKECIRQFFGANCDCNPSYGPVTDPLYVAKNTVFLTSVNITATYSDVEFGGLSDASIYSFYYNKKTRYVVLSIKMPLTVNTPNLCFEYRRPGNESIIKCDCATVSYNSLIFTAEFPGLPKCRLDLADIHGYISENPNFFIGPNINDSTDPTVTEAYAALLTSVSTVVRENILFQSHLFFAKYMQSNICDFNVKICSV